MNEFRSILDLRRHHPEKLQVGVNYILVAKTLFKIGATKNPGLRISVQPFIGSSHGFDGEKVQRALVTEPMAHYKETEKALKRAGIKGLRFAAFGHWGGSRPSESFHIELLPLFKDALLLAENGLPEGFAAKLEEITAACEHLKPAREWEAAS